MIIKWPNVWLCHFNLYQLHHDVNWPLIKFFFNARKSKKAKCNNRNKRIEFQFSWWFLQIFYGKLNFVKERETWVILKPHSELMSSRVTSLSVFDFTWEVFLALFFALHSMLNLMRWGMKMKKKLFLNFKKINYDLVT